jgi:hypothetical protein
MTAINLRVGLVIGGFVLLALLMGSRLVFLHLVDREFLQKESMRTEVWSEI